MSLNVKTIKETGDTLFLFPIVTTLFTEPKFINLDANMFISARYTTTTFISALGGALGAWMGFSCCMIFEVASQFGLNVKTTFVL